MNGTTILILVFLILFVYLAVSGKLPTVINAIAGK